MLMADKVQKRLEEQSRKLFQEHLLFVVSPRVLFISSLPSLNIRLFQHHLYLIVNQQQRQRDVQFRIISPGFREYRVSHEASHCSSCFNVDSPTL